MNRALEQAFSQLRVTERTAVLQQVGGAFPCQGRSESIAEYATKCLRIIEKDGTIRELEQALLRFQ